MSVERMQTTGSWEESLGSARAVAVGDLVLVAGTVAPSAGSAGEGPYEQARAAIAEAVAALEPFGLDARAVVRTRLFLSHARDAEDVARAHREAFGGVQPVTTLVVVSGFADSRAMVQVELEAFRGERGGDA